VCAPLIAANTAFGLLYDIDFGTPPHTVGLPPAVGAGPPPRATVSSINRGTPTVRPSFGNLTDQPLVFDSFDAEGDQIQLNLTDLPASLFYQLRCQIELGNMEMGGTFTILFDTPQVRTITFQPTGNVNAFVPGVFSGSIGTVAIGAIVDLRVDVDLAANNWEIFLDNVSAHSGGFGGAGQVNDVRISTNVTVNPPGVAAALDNVIISEAPIIPTQPCEQLGFEDLPLGMMYPAGSNFVTGGVSVGVGEFFSSVGPCGPPTTSNFARVVALGRACRSGQELEVNNVTLRFNFGDTVSDVVVPYGEYGGTVDLGINGDCRVVQNFADLHGAVLGGVTVRVIDFGAPGQGCGVLILDGLVTDLLIGGQELFIDDLSFCRPCPEPKRSTFEDVPLGTVFTVPSSFTSGDANFDILRFFFPGPTCSNPFAGGLARIENGGRACGGGRELAVNNVNVKIDFGMPLDWLVLSYGELGGNLNLWINGDCRNFDNFADVSGSIIGGVQVFNVDFGPPGNSCGVLYAVGPIDEFIVGGQELWIDNIRACPRETTGLGDVLASPTAGSTLSQNVPNPFNPTTTIGFELNREGQARITVYDIAGRYVRTLVDSHLPAGANSVAWNGLDDHGQRVKSGVYFYKLESEGYTATRRMVVIK
jgi:hypothetical protein